MRPQPIVSRAVRVRERNLPYLQDVILGIRNPNAGHHSITGEKMVEITVAMSGNAFHRLLKQRNLLWRPNHKDVA